MVYEKSQRALKYINKLTAQLIFVFRVCCQRKFNFIFQRVLPNTQIPFVNRPISELVLIFWRVGKWKYIFLWGREPPLEPLSNPLHLPFAPAGAGRSPCPPEGGIPRAGHRNVTI